LPLLDASRKKLVTNLADYQTPSHVKTGGAIGDNFSSKAQDGFATDVDAAWRNIANQGLMRRDPRLNRRSAGRYSATN